MKKKLILIFLIAFVFRLLLINTAFHGDLNNNISWGNSVIKYGTNGYYEQKVWEFSQPNQPPLYILLFGLTSWIYQTIYNLGWYLNNNIGAFPSSFIWFWQTKGMVLLVKLPSILADLGIGYFIYKMVKKSKFKMGLTILWLFNPLTFYNSSIWGQTDSIVNLLGIISIFYLLNKRLVPSVMFFVLGLLFKGSLIIFLPFMLLIWILQKHTWEKWLKAVLISGVLSTIIAIWFHVNIDLPIWLFNLYTQRFFPGEVGYLTANAFNFWYLVNPGKILDSTPYLGTTAHTIGYIISLIISFILIVKNKATLTKEKTILFLLSAMALISFLFFTRIHERYLYPFFPVATLLIGLIPSLIFPYIILSFVFLLNMYNLFWAPGIPLLENSLLNTSLPTVLSVVNIIVFFYIVIMYFRNKSKV